MFESTTKTLAKQGVTIMRGMGRDPFRSWKKYRRQQWKGGAKKNRK